MRRATDEEWDTAVYEAMEDAEIMLVTAWVRPKMAKHLRAAWWRAQPPQIRLHMIGMYRLRCDIARKGGRPLTFAQMQMRGMRPA